MQPRGKRERESTSRAGGALAGAGGGSPDRRSLAESLEYSEGQALCQALSILRHRICSGLRWAHGQLMVPTALECSSKPPRLSFTLNLLPSQRPAGETGWVSHSVHRLVHLTPKQGLEGSHGVQGALAWNPGAGLSPCAPTSYLGKSLLQRKPGFLL